MTAEIEHLKKQINKQKEQSELLTKRLSNVEIYALVMGAFLKTIVISLEEQVEAIDEMPIGTLDWAMQQVENTVAPEIETPSGDLQEQQLWDIKKLLKREAIEAYNHANRLMSKRAMPSEVLRVYNTEILEIIESLKI